MAISPSGLLKALWLEVCGVMASNLRGIDIID